MHAYDPAVRTLADRAIARVEPDAIAACVDADAVVVATEWPEFAALDLGALRGVSRGDLLVDGRGVIDPARAAEAGFRYRRLGAAPGRAATRLRPAPGVALGQPARTL